MHSNKDFKRSVGPIRIVIMDWNYWVALDTVQDSTPSKNSQV